MLQQKRFMVLLWAFALVSLSFARSASADEAATVAARAWEVHQAQCAEVAAGSDASAADSMVEVTEVWREVISTYEKTGASFLLYWRGVLAQCLGQPERAAEDLKLFVALEEFEDDFAAQVRDARARLRRVGVDLAEPTAAELAGARELDKSDRAALAKDSRSLRAAARAARTPFFLLGLAGGYQRSGDFNYGMFGVDISLRLVGPLRIEVSGHGGVSVNRTTPGNEPEETQRYLLMAVGVGPTLEFDGPVRPRVGVWFQLAPNGSQVGGPMVLPGFVVHGGVDIPLKGSPIALRPAVEGGMLGPLPTADHRSHLRRAFAGARLRPGLAHRRDVVRSETLRRSPRPGRKEEDPCCGAPIAPRERAENRHWSRPRRRSRLRERCTPA